jgi:serine/threonine-protein kinase HipA
VGVDEADATLDNAMSMSRLFALKKDEAAAEVRRVCAVVRGWRAHFGSVGVRPRDIELLAEQIDRPFLRDQREGF